MPAFNGAAVKFTQHAAPVPLSYLLFGADLFPSVTEFGENGGERHDLRLVRQVAIQENVLQGKKLCSSQEASQHVIA